MTETFFPELTFTNATDQVIDLDTYVLTVGARLRLDIYVEAATDDARVDLLASTDGVSYPGNLFRGHGIGSFSSSRIEDYDTGIPVSLNDDALNKGLSNASGGALLATVICRYLGEAKNSRIWIDSMSRRPDALSSMIWDFDPYQLAAVALTHLKLIADSGNITGSIRPSVLKGAF